MSEALGLTSILKRPGAVLPLAILSVTAVCLAVLYPTLQPHMHGVSCLHWVFVNLFII